MKKGKNKKKNQGFSLIELLIVVAIILIIAAIAIPNLLRARRSANEGSATASMRTIGSGELLYRSTQGAFGTLAQLQADSIIDNVLGSGTKSGYSFTAAPLPGAASTEFDSRGTPLSSTGATATGLRNFFVDATQVVRFSTTAAASSSSSAID
ncbi:MAG: prepilin-type N-terminal cleavage/methylation domain-containing protein [Acidobacteria bacterium]|nr:prepilin-type N-terminal cleavage/methylation domain-containing protein [Acidobacteriota bacterium]